MSLPPCGLYRTTVPIGSTPANRLVYFHNHGDPGPGIYLPESWHQNRATFSPKGLTLPEPELAETLEPLAAEGLYHVEQEFTCCPKKCRTYPKGRLVQLGYNGSGEPILFEPAWSDHGLSFPNKGQRIDSERVDQLTRLQVADPRQDSPGDMLH